MVSVECNNCKPVMPALEEIKNNKDKTWNSDFSSEASTLFDACSNFKFLMALVVCRNIVGYTAHLTIKHVHVIRCLEGMHHVRSTQKHSCWCVGRHQQLQWFDTAVSLGQLLDEEFVASKPRTNHKQTHRPNYKADTM